MHVILSFFIETVQPQQYSTIFVIYRIVLSLFRRRQIHEITGNRRCPTAPLLIHPYEGDETSLTGQYNRTFLLWAGLQRFILLTLECIVSYSFQQGP